MYRFWRDLGYAAGAVIARRWQARPVLARPCRRAALTVISMLLAAPWIAGSRAR